MAGAEVAQPDEAPRVGSPALWDGVYRLVARAPRVSDLLWHRIELLALRRLRRVGERVPPELLEREHVAQISTLVAPLVVERIRAACDGPLLVLKGPEVAAHYPDPSLRAFGDIDLLVPDAERVQRSLLAAGFQPIGDPSLYVGIHHLRPLRCPGLPMHVEVHSQPKWVSLLPAPPLGELLEAARPSATGVDGVAAPALEHQALLLAAHSWAHEPLRRLRDLIDVAATTDAAADRAEIERIARRWSAERLWRTTIAAADAVLLDDAPPRALGLWAQNLREVRERTVFEEHVQRWLSSFSILPPARAAATLGPTLARELRPAGGESVGSKARRTVRAFRNASTARSEHNAPIGHGPPRERRRHGTPIRPEDPPSGQ